MGKSEKIPLIIRRTKTKEYIAAWHYKSAANVHGLGKPTDKKLGDWRDEFNKSLLKGGANDHLGINYWMQYSIEVYSQITGEVLAAHNPPMFEVIPHYSEIN